MADHQLAVDAGLEIGKAGGIAVNEQMQTSDPNIYAVGDAAEKTSLLTGEPQMIWLANLANRHGRLVADVIAGEEVVAKRSIGTASSGPMAWRGANWTYRGPCPAHEHSHKVIHLHPASHAGYYPGAERVSLKVLFDPETASSLVLRGWKDGVDKRIDVIATAIYAGLSVDDL